jgi:hypothetical protein
LALVDRVTIGKDIAKAEFGSPIGMPSCRAMGAGDGGRNLTILPT